MEYNKIIAVTGLPGLYELLSSKSDGAIVRSLDDKTTRFVSSRIHNFSHLESIEVYTVRDNVNLVDILKAMEVGKDKLPDDKDANALKAYFTKVYPDLDFTRVYSSDLKKMVKWYAVLKANNIEIKLSEPEEDGQEMSEDTDNNAGSAPKKKEEATSTAVAGKPAAAAKAKSAPAEKTAAAPAKTASPKATPASEKTADKKDKPAAGKKAAAEPKSDKKAAAKSTGKSAAAKAGKEKKASGKSADKPKGAAKKK